VGKSGCRIKTSRRCGARAKAAAPSAGINRRINPMKNIAKIALPFFYFVISANGLFVSQMQFPNAKQCLDNAYAMANQLPNNDVSYCYDSANGQPLVTDIFNAATK
jgi:hypothetical protein